MAIKKYQIRLLKLAEEDFAEIVNFIASENSNVANEIVDKIEMSLESLSEKSKT